MAKILIVDDDAGMLRLQTAILTGAGHQVVTATNGREALQAVEDVNFALVITDVIMPEKDGLETIAHLHRKYPALKIVAVSGGGPIEPKSYLDTARKLGAVQTLSKPYTPDQLTKLVEKVLKY